MRPALHFAKKMWPETNDIYGVEVGVCEGHNALATLTEWDIHLIGVEIDESRSIKIRERFKGWTTYSLIVADSKDAAELFPDESLDFVYIDDDHEGDGPARSLNAWWPKVRVGGIICGHDYFPAGQLEDDVRRCVNQFFIEHQLVLHCDEWDFWGVKYAIR